MQNLLLELRIPNLDDSILICQDYKLESLVGNHLKVLDPGRLSFPPDEFFIELSFLEGAVDTKVLYVVHQEVEAGFFTIDEPNIGYIFLEFEQLQINHLIGVVLLLKDGEISLAVGENDVVLCQEHTRNLLFTAFLDPLNLERPHSH